MNAFDKVWQELEKFFSENGHPDPCNAIETIKISLSHCLNLGLYPHDYNQLSLLSSEVFAVSQFLNNFGCHLDYLYSVKPKKYYTIAKNW